MTPKTLAKKMKMIVIVIYNIQYNILISEIFKEFYRESSETFELTKIALFIVL